MIGFGFKRDIGSQIPKSLQEVAAELKKNRRQVYLVGGAVRDALRGIETKDWDLATDAPLWELEASFPKTIPIGREHGTLLLTSGGLQAHISTFKGQSIEEDLGRRDFTINSMAYDIQSKKILDPYGGKRDLKREILRGIHPTARFLEDPLRMLRLFRFVGQLGFKIEKKTLEGVDPLLISGVKVERIAEEMRLLLLSSHVERGLSGLYKTGLLEAIIPPFRSFKGEERILNHIFKATAAIYPALPLRWAALLHDLGKGETKIVDERGVHFYGHDKLSRELGDRVMTELRLSEKMKKKVLILVRHHMFSLDPMMSHRAISRLVRRVGRENIEDLLELRRADIMATTGRFDVAWERFSAFSRRIEELLSNREPFSIKDLVIDGRDVMDLMDLEEGPQVGEILEEALEWVMENRGSNTRGDLERFLREKNASE